MPYTLSGNCVKRADTGETVPGGCHPNRKKALAHLIALRANVHKEISRASDTFKAYNPRQLRHPKGHPQGGQWKKSGISGRMFDRAYLRGRTSRLSDGTTVRSGFLTGGETRAVNAVLRAINGVHKVSGLPHLTIRTSQNPAAPFFGAYHIGQNRITITSAGAHPHMTAAHEIGHFLDHRGFGAVWGSSNSPKLAGWRKAIEASPTIKQWRQWEKDGFARRGRFKVPISKAHTRYYLNPRELFARSYAQYIARRSGHRSLLRELRFLQSSGLRTQWSDAEFEPIAKELDRLLRSLGW